MTWCWGENESCSLVTMRDQRKVLSITFNAVTSRFTLQDHGQDFELVVLLLPTTPLNQTLGRSTSPPYILRYRYYSPGLFITIEAIPTISLFTETHHRHWSHSPFLNNP